MGDLVPVYVAPVHRRVIPMLHTPNQVMWWRRLAFITFLSQEEYSIFGPEELGLVPDGEGYWVEHKSIDIGGI